MRAYHPAGLALAVALVVGLVGGLSLSAGPAGAQTRDSWMIGVSECSGTIKGVATAFFALGGDEQDLRDDLYSADMYFFGATRITLGSDPDSAEVKAYSKIQTDRVDEVIAMMRNGSWGGEDYEDTINCYAEAATFFLEEMPDLKLPEARIRKLSIDQVKVVKTLLGQD
jgi:hypothetical protein